MSVAYPWALGVGGVLLGLMILWHILRPKSPVHVVPSLQLWRDLMPDAYASRPIHPPNPWWLLLVRLLIVSVLTLAAAGPIVNADTVPQHMILVVDTSASMATRQNDFQRIDYAKRYARQLIASAPVGSDITVLQVHATVEVMASRESDRTRISQVLDTLTVVPVVGNLGQLAQWIRAISGRTSMVYVLSDDKDLMQFDWPSAWQRIRIGSDVPNDAIDDVLVTQGAEEWQVRVRVRHYGPRVADATRLIEVRDTYGRLIAANRIQFDDDGVFVWEFSLIEPVSTLQLYLSSSATDALAIDDALYWHTASNRPLQVVIQSNDQRFIPAALAILPNTQVITDIQQADMVIIAGQSVADVPAKPVWLIDAQMPESTTVSLPNLERVTLSGIESRINRDIDMTRTQILTATLLDVPMWGQRWLTSQSGTHAYLGSRDGMPTVVFGFDVAQSDIVLRPEFPLLVRNILDYLTPSSQQTAWQTGQDIPLGPAPTAPQLERTPDGSDAVVEFIAGQYVLRHVLMPGVYQLDSRTIVVNMQSRNESDVARRDVPNDESPTAYGTIWDLTLAQVFALIGGILLIGERWLALRQRRLT